MAISVSISQRICQPVCFSFTESVGIRFAIHKSIRFPKSISFCIYFSQRQSKRFSVRISISFSKSITVRFGKSFNFTKR